MQKPVFLIFTDSVALPRKHKLGKVFWNETYISKIKESYPNFEVINISIGGASIKDLRNQVNYYKALAPQVVILQCGIVDAAPRAFGRIEMDIIKKLRLFRITKPFVSFLRKNRSHHYTSLKDFENKLVELKTILNPKRFLALGILPSCDGYEKALPGVTKTITNYNAILIKHAEFISLDQIPREGILEDFHHINAIGHTYIYEQLKERLF
jgi:hypothetical protein